MTDIKVGPLLNAQGKAWAVEATTGGRKLTVYVPQSIAQVTTEGVPQRKYVWAPAWWCEKNNVTEYREPKALLPLQSLEEPKQPIAFGQLAPGDRFVAYGTLFTKLGDHGARKHEPASIKAGASGYGCKTDPTINFEQDEAVFFRPPQPA